MQLTKKISFGRGYMVLILLQSSLLFFGYRFFHVFVVEWVFQNTLNTILIFYRMPLLQSTRKNSLGTLLSFKVFLILFNFFS